MKSISKKIIAIMLCITVLTSLVMNLTFLAEDSADEQKAAIIEAWQDLAVESKTVTETVGVPKTDGYVDVNSANIYRGEVKSDTDVGINNELLGTYYVDKYQVSKNDTAPGWSYTPMFENIDPALSGYDEVYLYITATKLDDTAGSAKIYVQTFGGGAENTKENIGNWTKFSLGNGESLKNIKIVVLGGAVSYISFGSLIGVRTINGPQLPDGYADMTASELVAAASEVDCKGFPSSDAFETAILAVDTSETAELIAAWKKLSYKESAVIGYCTGVEEISNIPAELNLTDAQKEQMGTQFRVFTGIESSTSFNFPYKGKSLAEFEKITYSVYADPGTAINFNLCFGNDAAKLDLYPNYTVKGFETKDITSYIRDRAPALLTEEQKLNSVKYAYWGGSGNLYVGSILGWKTVYADVVPDAVNMTAVELYEAAIKVDLSKYDTGVEKFKSALEKLRAKAYPEVAALIEAWNNLSYEKSTVIGYCTGAEEIANIPAELNLTDEQKAQMGTHYKAFTGIESSTSFNFPYKGKSLAEFEKITYSVYADPTTAISFNLCFGNDSVKLDLYPGYSVKGFDTKDITSYIKDRAPALLTEEQKLNSVKYAYWGGSGNLYVGSLLGWKTIKAEIPDNISQISLKELYLEASTIDTSKYTDGAEEFISARTELYNLLETQGEFDAESEALDNLIMVWKKISADTKDVTKVVAVPRVEGETDINTSMVLSKEVTTETVVEGLSDSSVLGTHWVEKFQTSKDDTIAGWGNQYRFTFLESPVKDYNKLYFYVATYKADGSIGAAKKVYAQNNMGDEYGTTLENVGTWTKLSIRNGLSITSLKVVPIGNGCSYYSFGSLIGEFTVSGPQLPENYNALSLTDLVKIAKKSDYEGFANTEEFKSALEAAEKLVDNSPELAERLIEEWRKLVIKETRVVAVPTTSGAKDIFDNTVYSKEVTSETVVEGLSDTSVLGTHWVDKFQVSKDDTISGWGKQYPFEFLESPIKDYSELYFYVATYKADGTIGSANKIFVQNNAGDANSTTLENVGSWRKLSMKTGLSLTTMKVVPIGNGCSYISFGSIIGVYEIRPEIPEDAEKLSFEDLVKAAADCDVSGYEADGFKAALKECQDLITQRKQNVIKAWQALGIEKPESADELSISELANAALELDFSATDADTTEFGNAVWMLNLLTNDGKALDALREAWKKIDKLPDDYRLLSASEWLLLGDQLDISEADKTLQDNFTKALEVVRDITTKGKGDITYLKRLYENATTMNYYDFTAESWLPFGEAREAAKSVINNYSEVTQKTIDAAKDELLAAWGGLRMYVRTQWLDFYSYLIEEEPGMKIKQSTDPDTSVGVSKAQIPNGANAAIDIENQKSGWYPVGVSGVRLEKLSKYEFLEIWIKAEPDQKMSSLLWQFNKSGGNGTYNGSLILPEGAKCGEWYRLEFPLSDFESDDHALLLDNKDYQAFNVDMMVQGGNGTYSLSNIAAVRTESVIAGIVPNVPKMEIKEREKPESAAPPKNPFEGVDRGDPWGLLEQTNKPDDSLSSDKVESDDIETDIKDSDTNETVIEQTDDEESNNEEIEDSWGTDEPEEEESSEAEIVESGSCGENIIWTFYDDGTLIISGTGDMENYEDMAPWLSAGYDVINVVIEDGVTSIGDSAFYGCVNLISLKVPASVTRVGAFAFYECYSLTELKISASVKEIGAYAFGYVYDAESGNAVVLDGFKLYVCKPSEALKYAKTYEVPYEVYVTADSVVVEDGFAWWFWALIATGSVIVVAGAGLLVFVILKKKKG